MSSKLEVLDPKFRLESITGLTPTWKVRIHNGFIGFLRDYSQTKSKPDFSICMTTKDLPPTSFRGSFRTKELALAALETEATAVYHELCKCQFIG